MCILQTTHYNSIFGFDGGSDTGVAYENSWITASDNEILADLDTDWLLSSQSAPMYRGNGVDYTTGSGSPGTGNLMINAGYFGNHISDWACAAIIIFNEELELEEVMCIEEHLNAKYNLSIPDIADANYLNQSSTCSSTEYAWQRFLEAGNGVFDLGEGVWDFPFNLDFDDNNVIIRGQGAALTTNLGDIRAMRPRGSSAGTYTYVS